MKKTSLNEYRFFDPDSRVRNTAYELYQEIRGLPIVSPHGHVEPALLALNEPFPNPAELIIIPDHYIFRMLYSQGISMASLGIAAKDDTPSETNARKIWQIFAEHFYLFTGTPSGIWLRHELDTVFGISEELNGESGQRVYDQIQEKLLQTEYLPRPLFDRFNIEVLTTTDGASDTLEHHQTIQNASWNGRVIPCFRPDAVVQINAPGWKHEIESLSNASGIDIQDFKSFLHALENRRKFFKSIGAVSTDQGILTPFTYELTDSEAEAIFQRAPQGEATGDDAKFFTANILLEMARMSIEDGMVMQIHPGSFRNHNQLIFEKFGPDKGCDIPTATEYTRNLPPLLNKYGNDPG